MAEEASAGMQNLNIQEQKDEQQQGPKPTVILVIGAARLGQSPPTGGGLLLPRPAIHSAAPKLCCRHGGQREDDVPAAVECPLA